MFKGGKCYRKRTNEVGEAELGVLNRLERMELTDKLPSEPSRGNWTGGEICSESIPGRKSS